MNSKGNAIISIDGMYVGSADVSSGRGVMYFDVTPGKTHKIRISYPGYYDRVLDFYFDKNTPFITLPDGTKETTPAFYYSFEGNKVSTSTSGRYKMREDYPFLKVSPSNAKITFKDIKSNKKFVYYHEQPIDNLQVDRDYILTISASGFETFTDKLHFDGFFDYTNNYISLKYKTRKNKCTC